MKIETRHENYSPKWGSRIAQSFWKLREACLWFSSFEVDRRCKGEAALWAAMVADSEGYRRALLALCVKSIKVNGLVGLWDFRIRDYWVTPFAFIQWCHHRGIPIPFDCSEFLTCDWLIEISEAY